MGVALSAGSPSPPSPRTEEGVKGSLPCCCVGGGGGGGGGAQVVPVTTMGTTKYATTTNEGTTNTEDGDQSYPSPSANSEGSKVGHHRASSLLPSEGGVKPSCTAAGDGNIPSGNDVIGVSEAGIRESDAFDSGDHGVVVLPPPRRSSNLSQGTSLLVQALSNSKSGFGKPRLNCTSTATTPSLSDVQEIEPHPPRNGTPQESQHQEAKGAVNHCLQLQEDKPSIGRKDNEAIPVTGAVGGGDIESCPHEVITPVAVTVSKGPSSSQVVCVPPSFAEHQNGKQAPQRAQLQALESDEANPLSFNDANSDEEEEVIVVGLQPLTMMGVVSNNTTTCTTNTCIANNKATTRSSRRLQEALCVAETIHCHTTDEWNSSSTTPSSSLSLRPRDEKGEGAVKMITAAFEGGGGGGDAFGESNNLMCANNNNSVLCTTASGGGAGRSTTHLLSQEKREELISCDGQCHESQLSSNYEKEGGDGLSSSPASGFATMQSTRNLQHHGVLGFSNFQVGMGHSPISLHSPQCSSRMNPSTNIMKTNTPTDTLTTMTTFSSPHPRASKEKADNISRLFTEVIVSSSPAVSSSDSIHRVSVVPSSGSLRFWRPPGLIGAEHTEGEEEQHPTPLNQSHVNEWSFSYGGGAPELAADDDDDLDPLGGSSIKKEPLRQQSGNYHGLLGTSEGEGAIQHKDESEPVGEYFGSFQRLNAYDCHSKVQQQRRSQQEKFGSVLFTTVQQTSLNLPSSLPSRSSSRHQSNSQLLHSHQPQQTVDSSHRDQHMGGSSSRGDNGETMIVVAPNGSSRVLE